MTAMGTYSDGNLKNLTPSVTWSSNNAAVTVNAAGLVTGVAAGSATISAASGIVSGNTLGTVPASAPTTTTVTLLPVADNTISYSSNTAAWQTTVYSVNAFHPNSIAVGCNWYAYMDPIAQIMIQNLNCAQSLVKFDLASLAGKTIQSATLRLQTNIYGVGYVPRQWFVQALASFWTGASVTWDSASNFLHYTYSRTTQNPPAYSNQMFDLDQTNTVRNWVAGTYANDGLEFGLIDVSFPYAISLDAFEFYSSEDAGGRGPKLIVTYQ